MSLEQADLITAIQSEVKGLTAYLDTEDYTSATNEAILEFGSSYPVTDTDMQVWVKRRSKRHLFYYLMTEAAHKFKFEQINLQQRFDHYFKLIKVEDEAFAAFIEDRPDLFANVDTHKLFGTLVSAGFSYDALGRDTTYDDIENNEVDFTPKEAD